MPPDFVVLGHFARDEHADGSFTLGGVPTFAAITARNLGYRVGVVTSCADDLPQTELLHDIEIVRTPSPTTTSFRNVYEGARRKQYVCDVAAPILASSIPPEWRTTKIALLGPIANELGVDMAGVFSKETLVGITPQGWMRQWDDTGRVKPRAWVEAAELLPHVNALILSQEDLGSFTERLSSYILLAPLVALTRGPEGVTIYRKHERPLDVPSFPANPLDPTGAGDSFATAFLIGLHETNDLLQAARFANAAASLAIETKGAANMPTRERVQARMNGLR